MSILRTPTAYNTIKLDGELCPGLAKIVGDGKREQEWQETQQPGTTGPSMNFRLEHAAKVVYAVKFWRGEQEDAVKAWIAKLVAGKDQRPPKVWTLSDLRLEHNKIRRIAYHWCGPLEDGDQPTSYQYQVAFVEKPLVKQMGGILKAPANPREELITRLSAENTVLDGALKNMDVARRTKK